MGELDLKYHWVESSWMKIIICLILFWASRVCRFAPTYLESKIWHVLGLWILFFGMSIRVYIEIPFYKMQEKIFYLTIALYAPIAMGFYYTMQMIRLSKYHGMHAQLLIDYENESFIRSIAHDTSKSLGFLQEVFVPAMLAFTIFYFIFLVYKRLDKRYADTPSDKNIVAVYKYPTDFVGFVLAFALFPKSSVSVYADGYRYHFNREKGELCKTGTTLAELKSDRYFTRNTGIHPHSKIKELDALVGTKWTLRTNCLNIFKPILGKRVDKFFKVVKWKQ